MKQTYGLRAGPFVLCPRSSLSILFAEAQVGRDERLIED